MSEAETTKESSSESDAVAPPKRSRLPLIMLLLVFACAAGAGYYFYGAELLGQDKEAVVAAPIYVPMDPPFVVNLENSELLRFLQVELQIMTRDAAVAEALEQHAPVIRNNLLLILAAERTENLGSRAGKTDLQQRITAEINAVLAERAGGVQVEETYFTSFVMQ